MAQYRGTQRQLLHLSGWIEVNALDKAQTASSRPATVPWLLSPSDCPNLSSAPRETPAPTCRALLTCHTPSSLFNGRFFSLTLNSPITKMCYRHYSASRRQRKDLTVQSWHKIEEKKKRCKQTKQQPWREGEDFSVDFAQTFISSQSPVTAQPFTAEWKEPKRPDIAVGL